MFEDPSFPDDTLSVSPSERKRRQLQFARVLNATALIYTFLHKFFVPLILYALGTKTEFRVLDWWWIYHVILAFTLKRTSWCDSIFCLVIGFGFGGLIIQSCDALMAEGWHAFSLWLTTITSGAILIYIIGLIPTWTKQIGLNFFSGVVLGLLMMGTTSYWFGLNRYTSIKKITQESVEQKISRLNKSQICGTRSFSLTSETQIILPGDVETSNHLVVKDCGFAVALQKVDPSKPIDVINEGSTFLNIRLNHLIGQRWQSLTNRPLRIGETFQIVLPISATEGVWVLESDSRPQAGLTVIFSDIEKMSRQIKSAGIAGSVIFSREGIFLSQ